MDRNNYSYYYIYDGFGSARFLTSSSDKYNFDAFGNLLNTSTNSTLNTYLFNGQQFDVGSQSYYLRARYYNPYAGRFLSQDPYSGRTENPVSLHRYIYSNNDPVNFMDPSGAYTAGLGYAIEPVLEARYSTDPLWVTDVAAGKVLFGKPVGVGNNPALKPDFFNFAAKDYMELKPLTPTGVAHAVSQMKAYKNSFESFGYSPNWWWLFVPEELPVLTTTVKVFNIGGVLFYTEQLKLDDDDIDEAQQVAASYEQIGRGARHLLRKIRELDLQDNIQNTENEVSDWIALTGLAIGVDSYQFSASYIATTTAASLEAEKSEEQAAITLNIGI